MPLPTPIKTPKPAELRTAALSTLATPKNLTIIAGVFVAIFALLLITKIIKSIISKTLIALLVTAIAVGILYHYSLITIRF